MENQSVLMMVAAFIAIIVGVALIGSIATGTQAVTTLSVIDDEVVSIEGFRDGSNYSIRENDSVSVAQATAGSWKADYSDCNLVATYFGNSTLNLIGTNYSLSSAGILTLTNTTHTYNLMNITNSTIIDYTYCGDDYLATGWNRTVLNLTPGFFGLAILGIGIGLFYFVFKREGII